MNRTTLSRSDAVVSIILAIVVLAVGYQVAVQKMETYPRLRLGVRLPALTSSVASRKPLLILVLRKGCHFCEASMPFYKKLVTMERSGQLETELLAAFPDEAATGASVLSTRGVAIPNIGGADMEQLGINGTPTVIVVGQNRRVAAFWVGKLDSEGEARLIDTAAHVPEASWFDSVNPLQRRLNIGRRKR